ncbi:DNA-3-methyladenine glycosylase I [Sphingomonas immobilis]|uniref:DNA-3-methyladenine glycosylase I n=1 Tax=Sphingomonas immobilis TaxID=3063997 RepID=A0ABT8ZYF0_9SPHN|nr:DNA-3-methyladenine glycosylase I [Sphingomonas sp. CA1-15]MDO7842610.1 DNA-3-methyladenine glycosylase I [Sphingomonas sp. CA1-15]
MDDRQRCAWAGSNPLMQHYHDTEWGVPERDPRMLWETLMLEGFQAGLSWEIILRKREGFRAAFAGFDPVKVAAFGDADIERLMADPGIVRARAKIVATITGARLFNEMQAAGEDFAAYCWSFTGGKPIAGSTATTQSDMSGAISKDLKKRGFKFVGPTIVYAWMQAVGITNDHEKGCFRRTEA